MARAIDHERNKWRYKKQPQVSREERYLEAIANRILEGDAAKVGGQ